MHRFALSGMTGFMIVWLGQLVSLVGSAMTGFALSLWAWQETGQATALALVGFFTFTPMIVFSPLAGVLVDRWNRKHVMILADFGSASSAVIMLLLYSTGRLEVWHLYLLGAWAGAFNAFHMPAYAATISTMLPKAQYARANSMLALAQSASSVAAPVLAGLFLGAIGLGGMLLLDILTFLVAFFTLLVATILQPRLTGESSKPDRGLVVETTYGFSYIFSRPSLASLLLLYVMINFIGAFGTVMISPLILARSGSDELALGSVLSSLGAGGILGGIVMSIWGGPKRRIHGVLLGLTAVCLFGYLPLGLGRSLALWMTGAFALTFFVPFLSGCNQAIWQAKVPPEVQGKVFAVRQFIAQITMPLVMLMAGPLADRVFEPAMMQKGPLTSTLQAWVGTGEGAGMALMFVLFGIMGTLVGLTGYLVPSVRRVELELPDHDARPTNLKTSI